MPSQEMQHEGSEGSEAGVESPTAEGGAAALEGGGSGRSGRRGRFLQRAGRFSQEAMDAKEDELKFLQQRCMQFEVPRSPPPPVCCPCQLCMLCGCQEGWYHCIG